MKKLMDGIFARYGQPALLCRAGSARQVRAFFWSSNSTSWQNMERMFLPLGEVPRGQYVCVLPADVTAEAGDTLELDTRQYLVRKLEMMSLWTGPVYQWGLCVEKGSEDAWGMNGFSE